MICLTGNENRKRIKYISIVKINTETPHMKITFRKYKQSRKNLSTFKIQTYYIVH